MTYDKEKIMSKNIKPTRKKHEKKPPLFQWNKKKLEIMCPFCTLPHAIAYDRPSECGVLLEIQAVRDTWVNATCALCEVRDRQPMIRIGGRYQHVHACSPGKRLFLVPPKPSLLAKIVYNLPAKFHLAMWKATKKVPITIERDGETIGYFFDEVAQVVLPK